MGIQDCAVTVNELGDSAVDSTKLADSAVSSAGIQDSTIVTIDLSDCAVTNAKLGDTAVVTGKINNTAVTYAKIQDVTAVRLLGREDAVAGSPQEIALSAELRFDTTNDWVEVSDSGILTGLIADSAVLTAKISDSQITYAKVQAVTAARLLGRFDATAAGVVQEITLAGGLTFDSTAGTIASDTSIGLTDSQVDSSILADSAVSSVGIQDGTIVAADIADSAIDSGKIADSAVTYQNIQSVTAQRLLGRQDALAGVTQEIPLSAELRFDTVNDWLEVSDSGITSGLIADSAILTAKISDSQITYAKIQAVTAVRLLGRWDALAGVTQEVPLSAELRFDSGNDWLEVSDSGITTGLIADSAVTTIKISDSQITTAKILDSNVTYAKIQAVAASRLLGRHDTTAGVVEEVALGGAMYFDTTNDAVAVTRIIEVIATDTTLTTGDAKVRFNIPSDMDSWDLVDADAAVDTNTSGVVGPTIQIRNATDAADMLSTKITIDTSEVTSYTAATAPVIDTANDSVITGNRIEIDVDSAGTSSGLRVILSFRKY